MGQTFVILAAGWGSRFNQLTFFIPKPLIKFGDQLIIDYALDNIKNHLPEVDTTIVVSGYKKKIMKEYIESIAPKYSFELYCVPAPDYKNGNGKSLLAAEPYATDPFFLAMCDHLFEETHYHMIEVEFEEGIDLSLCIDFSPKSNIQLDDATKVFTDRENNILHIGKNLLPWTAIDTGLFCLSPRIFKRLKQVSKKYVTVTDGVNQMIRHGDSVKGVDVSGLYWADIDTFTDLRNAELHLSLDVDALFSSPEEHFQKIDQSETLNTRRNSENP